MEYQTKFAILLNILQNGSYSLRYIADINDVKLVESWSGLVHGLPGTILYVTDKNLFFVQVFKKFRLDHVFVSTYKSNQIKSSQSI